MRSLAVPASVVALSLVLAMAAGTRRIDADPGIGLPARIVATGIPGAGAIAQIGTYHRGGPFNDNATFKKSTLPGEILDSPRLFVASTSNFGASLASVDDPAGSILSLDVNDVDAVVVPPDFAADSVVPQASASGGRVRLYTAQSPAFRNSVNLNVGVTGDVTAVSLPLGMSLNNGFGRPWFANAPHGSAGDGTITVVDPNGAPLKGAPSAIAGGVFAGNQTNRLPASTPGLTAAALATALVTKSSDGSGRAVFLAALADGRIVQVHVAKGVDALTPSSEAWFSPIANITTDTAQSSEPHTVTRVGMLFNWVPERTVFVSDPLANRILAFDLTDDGTLFHAANRRYFGSPFLNVPIDIAPAVPEVAARNFASNTTLGGGSDLYVLNRGNNSIVRMTQDGGVVAVGRIESDWPDFRANGIAVSDDARTIWISATAPGRQGIVLQIKAFGAGPVTTALIDHDHPAVAGAGRTVAQGADVFMQLLDASQFVGPLFNARSCNSCHNTPGAGGMGISLDSFVTRVGRMDGDAFDPMPSHGGPVARQHSVAELGAGCGLATGFPARATMFSKRSAMTLRGTALIDDIMTRDIKAAMDAEPAAVKGRLNMLPDGRVGRFGWKAQTATLVEFMGEAFRDEMGVTNPLAPKDEVDGCRASVLKPEADAAALTSLVAFVNTLDPPAASAACLGTSPAATGQALFDSLGCATCHKPKYTVPGSGASPTLVANLYSDLLLHDMGSDLADGFPQGSATGSEFRTAPLWRVSDRQHFLHDGRARSIEQAIASHGGQAAGAADVFNRTLDNDQRQALVAFLGCI